MTLSESSSLPGGILLRQARESDATAIRNLIRTIQINPTGLNWRRFLVAVAHDGTLVGCGQVKPHGDGSRELTSIAVDPVWRHQGLATRIIHRLLAENPPPLYLTCRSSLESFYTRFGFAMLPMSEMPPYCRRIYRLVNLIHALGLTSEHLSVMYLSAYTPGSNTGQVNST
jgi:N-acetylglutamate synthase-like GNAT family acetyltransferase